MSASRAYTPKMQLIASKATEAAQASTTCGRLPRGPKAARVKVIVGSPERTPAIEARRDGREEERADHDRDECLPHAQAELQCDDADRTKKRLAFVPTQK